MTQAPGADLTAIILPTHLNCQSSLCQNITLVIKLVFAEYYLSPVSFLNKQITIVRFLWQWQWQWQWQRQWQWQDIL